MLNYVDIAIVAIYALLIFFLAQWHSKQSGRERDSDDYFLASRSLPWWSIGTSLIAANISAEAIVGMAGSGYAIGIAIASYEWMAALTLLIVGKYFLPIFLHNGIMTMPQFLGMRYGNRIRSIMAAFWLGLYVFVNLTSIIWLGSIAVSSLTGINQDIALYLLGIFSLIYQLRGGLKAVAKTDIFQVFLLLLGGFAIVTIVLGQLSDGQGVFSGFINLTNRLPDHFHMILHPDNPYYTKLPGLSVLIGGLWIANLSYWGFNQYIIQRTLAAKNIGEAQKGIVFAAYLKLLTPLIIVLPGVAAALLSPGLAKPDEAYPTMMHLLPHGLLGLVFAALIAAVVASMASKINSIATIFTLDVYVPFLSKVGRQDKAQNQSHLVFIGRLSATIAILIAMLTARPLLGSFDQAFQFVQEYTGFFTPGIVVIFLLGLFWKGANETGAIAAAVGSFLLSITMKVFWPNLPFMERMEAVFLLSMALAVIVSLSTPTLQTQNRISMKDIDFSTSPGLNLAGFGVILILTMLYFVFW